jgi:hypothetical protein|nr:MAG TPA: hypothetical protein [Caudoviricetes sp.]
MARSYTIGEAAKILAEGKDFEAVGDLGRRFPIFTSKFMQALTGDKDAIIEFVGYIPDYVNPRKMEKLIVSDADESSEEETVEEEKAKVETKQTKPKRSRTRKAKAEPEPDVNEESVDEEQADGKYAGKNAMELFKECKKRDIKAQPKKPVKYYIELLEEDDEVVASESKDDADDDDEWDI